MSATKRYWGEQGRYRWETKLERGDGIGLAINSESKATEPQRRYWTGTPRARDQEEDQEAVGEESKRKMWKKVERHGQRPRSWP